MEKLTDREEHVMQILWELKEGVVRDVLAAFPEPQPPYTTVSSIVRILEEKGYVGHKAYGKTHVYFPLISLDDYRRKSIKNLVQSYFGGSYSEVVHFMVQEEKLPQEEVEMIEKLLEQVRKEEEND